MAFGITPNGFVKKTLAIIVSELESSYKTAISPNLNVRAPSNASILIGIPAIREAALWDMAEECYYSRSISGAQGVALDNARELTNEPRLEATPSRVLSQLLFGNVGTLIDTTTRFSVSGNPLAVFKPNADVTLIAGVSAIQHIAFASVPDAGTWTIEIGNLTTASLAFGADAAAVQAAIRLLSGFSDVVVTGDYSAGFDVTFGGDSGLQPQPLIVIDDDLTTATVPVGVTPSTITAGVAQGVALMVAASNGPTIAVAGTLTVIDTPVSGLNRTINTTDAILGRLVETDSEYRIRSEQEIQSTGKTTLEAIRTDLRKVIDVTQAIVFQNTGDTVDGGGRPPHSIQAFVEGGTDQDVADALWLATGGGIQTYGTIPVVITDSQGLSHTVNFSRPILKPIYVIVNITKDPDVWPVTGIADVDNAVDAYGATLQVGDDVLLRPKLLPAIVDSVPGIIDIEVLIGLSPSPTGTVNIDQAVNELATFDSSRITVNVT